MNIPVVSMSRLMNDNRPLLIIILAWNFRDEILDKLKRIRLPGNQDVVLHKYIIRDEQDMKNNLRLLF
jgi:hypothetical protein